MAGSSSLNGSTEATSLLERVLQALKDEGALDNCRSQPVVRFRHPADLKNEALFQNFGEPLAEEGLESVVRDVIKYSVKTQHPLFLNQLYGGVDPYGLAGAWLTEALNTNQHTFEVAPVFNLIELAVIERLLHIVGYGDGDGILAAGGSMANMYAMVLARYKLCPETKETGLYSITPLAAFVSSDSHYSIMKAAHWLGLGSDNLYVVDTDAEGRMIPAALDTLIQEVLAAGKRPFFVNATAGTTVLGAFDPFHPIADVCKKYHVWLHIDELLHKCNSASASYLFQQDKFYDTTYDMGDKSIQCGRKPDAFKIWLMWRARGDSGFSSLVDSTMDKSRYFLEQIRNRQDFRLVMPEFQCTNICFWYIPKCLQDQPETDDWWDRLGKVAPLIKQHVALKGSLLIGYQPLKHKKLPNFFRFVLACHPEHTEADLDRVVAEIEAAGKDLKV